MKFGGIPGDPRSRVPWWAKYVPTWLNVLRFRFAMWRVMRNARAKPEKEVVMSDWSDWREPPEGFTRSANGFEAEVVLSPAAWDELEAKLPMICRFAPPGKDALIAWFPGGLSVHCRRGQAP